MVFNFLLFDYLEEGGCGSEIEIFLQREDFCIMNGEGCFQVENEEETGIVCCCSGDL